MLGKQFLSVRSISLTLVAVAGIVSSGLSLAAEAPSTLLSFDGANNWENGNPVTKEQTNSKVVVVDFYTSRCSNCLAAVPHVAELYEKYRNRGLVVIGVHTPETNSERSSDVVDSTIKRLGIKYPVAVDNDSTIWNRFHNQYWPNLLIYDKTGHLVYSHAGEGHYEEIENKVESLL